MDCGETERIEPGQATPEAGRAAVEALRRAMQDLKDGYLDALVTAPFDKETVQSDEFRHTGHTEYLGAELGGEPLMIMCSEILRIGLVTKHIPVSEISRNITKEKNRPRLGDDAPHAYRRFWGSGTPDSGHGAESSCGRRRSAGHGRDGNHQTGE